jgi:hypothetical protein
MKMKARKFDRPTAIAAYLQQFGQNVCLPPWRIKVRRLLVAPVRLEGD